MFLELRILIIVEGIKFFVKWCEWLEVFMLFVEYVVVVINYCRVFFVIYILVVINYRMMELNILFFVISLIGNCFML